MTSLKPSRPVLGVLLLTLLSLSLLSLANAYSFSFPSSPPQLRHCVQQISTQGDPILSKQYVYCTARAATDFQNAMVAYYAARVPRVTWLEGAESFAALSSFVALWIGIRNLKAPQFLRRGYRVHALVIAASIALAVSGTFVLSLALMLDLSNFNPQPFSPLRPADYPLLYNFAAKIADSTGLHSLVSGWTDQWSVGISSFGLLTIASFSAAVCGVLLAALRRGLLGAIETAITFAGLVLFAFELCSLALNPEVMVMSVAQATSGLAFAGSVPFVSNYFVLVTVACPLAALAAWKGVRRLSPAAL